MGMGTTTQTEFPSGKVLIFRDRGRAIAITTPGRMFIIAYSRFTPLVIADITAPQIASNIVPTAERVDPPLRPLR